MNLDKTVCEIKSGSECLKNEGKELNYSLLDFWRWSVSDILSNATRGRFAEFVVATACGINIHNVRDEWSAYDLTTPENIKIEVKSAAYIQSWHQKAYSAISFSTRPAREWDVVTNKFSLTSRRHADIYVFCLLIHMDKSTIDPLNMDQWEFYVVLTTELNNYTRSRYSIGLKSLQMLTSAISYNDLHRAICEKASNN